jgi:hypothetical protein
MITKQLFSTLRVLLISGLLFVANQSIAQTRQYATAVDAYYRNTIFSNPISAAADGTNGNNLATAARVTTLTVAGLGGLIVADEGFVTLRFPSTVPANTTVYVKVGLEQAEQLQALVGGGLGSLLNNLLGQQTIEVSALASNGDTAFAPSTDFAQDRLRIVRDAAGLYYVKVTPNADFNRIRLTNRINGLLATRWLDVYGAFYASGVNGCALGTYTSYSGNGLVSLNLTTQGVTNPQLAIDGNATTASRISLGTVGVGAYIEQTVYFEGVPPAATDAYNVKLGINSGLLTINILNGVQILAYNGGNLVYDRALSSNDFLSLNLNTAITNNQPVSLRILPGQVIDRITVRLNGLVNVNALTNSIDIFEISKGSFAVSVAVAGGTGNSFRQGVPATLTASVTGCNGPFTYSWAGPGLTAGANTNSTLTLPNNVAPGSYTYTVTVKDIYGVVQTAETTIVVEEPPVPGTIAGAGNVCSGDVAGNLTLTGYTGSIVQWERSATPAFTSPQVIANTTPNLGGATFGALTSSVYVRALVRSNSYPDTYTPVVGLIVKTSTWNGTAWNNGIPDIGTTIIISGNYSVDADLSGCSLEVTNNAVVNIPTDRTVTLNKHIRVTTGSFTLQNNAHLIQLTNAVNTGNITLKRNSSSLFRLDYTLWSSPVVGQQLSAFSTGTISNRFYEYRYDYLASANNGAGGYVEQYFTTNPALNFEIGKGYLIRMPNGSATPGYNEGTATMSFTGSFTGVPVNGNVTKALSTDADRYTAIGNPYPSPINVQSFFNANETTMEPTSALYFWRKKNNSSANSYATLTRDAYTSNGAEGGNEGEAQFGGEQWNTFFNQITPSSQWVVNPGQGFFIRTRAGIANPVATFNNAMRVGTIHNPQFFRTAQPDQISRFWIDLKNETTLSQMAVVYSNTATTGIDAGRDGLMLSNGNLALYSIAESLNLSIQARPQFATSDVVALGYSSAEAGQYTINLRHKDGLFESNQSIYLNDKLTNVITDITAQDYTFSTEAGTFNERFEVIYTTDALGTEKPVLNANSVIVYKDGSTINITSGTAQMTDVNVYDLRGRMIYSKTGVNATTTAISGLQSAQQMLIIEVNTVEGKVSKKIIY